MPERNEGHHEAARSAAFRLLARRSRSVRELVDRLEKKGFPEPVVANVVERLKELNLLDDSVVARDWARSYAVNSLWGDLKIEFRLRSMGFSDEHITAALAEARTELPQVEAIRKIVEKRFPHRLTAPGISAKDEQRLVRSLASRGFSRSAVYEALAHPPKEDDGVDGQ